MDNFIIRLAGVEDTSNISLLYKLVWDEQKENFPNVLLKARQPDENEMKRWLDRETYFVANINNKISKGVPTVTRMTILNPNCSICLNIRNAKATNKEKTKPSKRDSVNGVSGNKNTLIMGTSNMGNRIATTTKRQFLSNHFAITFPFSSINL